MKLYIGLQGISRNDVPVYALKVNWGGGGVQVWLYLFLSLFMEVMVHLHSPVTLSLGNVPFVTAE
jgi:hypothetical protein